MENQSYNNNGRKPPQKQRVFGPKKVVNLSEETSSSLVGGILEKGFSDIINSSDFNTPAPTFSYPLPSTLPFPVARHRSHGPHWTPVDQFVAAAGGVDDDEDDENSAKYEPLADFAKPIKKKKKKGLDLSRWKEAIRSDIVSNVQNKDSTKSMREDMEQQKIKENVMRNFDKNSLVNEQSGDTDSFNDTPDLYESQLEGSTDNDVDMGFEDLSSNDMFSVREKDPLSTLGPSSVGYEQGHMDLESQIDAENRAMLGKMSVEEIAEAQAEIRNRLNPELLNILKNRGTKKLEKKADPGLRSNGVNVLVDKQADIIESDNLPTVREKTSMPAIQTMPVSQTKPDGDTVQNSLSKGSIVWSTWSKRVEAVRNLRFSLDGNVIEGSSLDPSYTADNVAERDFLRTDGDPAAAGYTMKEALSLARSVVPVQRTFAWHLLESILSKALHNLVDWEAIWAYALGPEPELALSLRLAIDDNHASVTLASAKVIQCILSCDLNEEFFNITMKLARMDLCTAPVFRSRPDIKHGFLGGGFWKYSTKPSNILSPDEEVVNDKNEGERTIHDDNIVAGQDVAAGLVRMELLHRLRYLLEKFSSVQFSSVQCSSVQFSSVQFSSALCSPKEQGLIPPRKIVIQLKSSTIIFFACFYHCFHLWDCGPCLFHLCYFFLCVQSEPSAALEECILSILIAVARHSPTCANAIWKFERLVQLVVNRFNMKDTLKLVGAKIKSVTLLRVLAQSSKTICMDFIDKGFFQVMTWQLYRVTPSIEEWVKLGSQQCKLASQLMVEQLRFWKVCVMYGRCISSFAGFFPALCLWLNPPTFDKLTEENVFNEFASITTEVYLVLETLASSLPDPFSSNIRNQQFCDSDGETWCWSDVYPMVNSALQWLELKNDTSLLKLFDQLIGVDSNSSDHTTSASSLLWILSSVMHFLHTVLLNATPKDTLALKPGCTNEGTLPKFVVKLALQIIKNGIFNFVDQNVDGCSVDLFGMSSFIDKLCCFRHTSNPEASVAAVWCLNTLFRLVVSTDCLIHKLQGKLGCKILCNDILGISLPQWEKVIDSFLNIVTSEWHHISQIEVFGRGGPAPGVGFGWGALRGGFWSSTVVAAQADVRLLVELLEPWLSSRAMELPYEKEKFMVKIINSALASSLMMGPGDKMMLQKIFDILLKIPVLKYLNQCILFFLRGYLGKESLTWENKEDDLIQLCESLSFHFTHRWLDEKKTKEKKTKPEMKIGNSLATIPEEVETSDDVAREDRTSLMVEWARQQMPLPSYWLLSPITTISIEPPKEDPHEFLHVAKAGLFLLLGIEAMSFDLSDEDNSPVRSIPLIWRVHSLSVPLLVGKGVLEEERSRDMFEALQGLYGQHIDELQFSKTTSGGCLRFQAEIHESYTTFLETLVEQFAAVSYGDVIYGRQIAIYLHRQVETSVRLATWNALSNARVLELLPPLDKCVSRAEGYLGPVEDDDAILEAYVKSWVSGALDRSVIRGSMSYMIAVHHLSSFIFNSSGGERSLLRNKLIKSLLRDFSRKRQHEAMMLDLIQHNRSESILKTDQTVAASLQADLIGERMEMLKEACQGSSQLLTEVDKLKSSIMNKQNGAIRL